MDLVYSLFGVQYHFQQCTHHTFIYLFGVLHHFKHCTGHIMPDSRKGRGNQYIQLVKVLYCTVHCRPMASNYQLSHLRPCREPNPSLRGGRRECYQCVPCTCHIMMGSFMCRGNQYIQLGRILYCKLPTNGKQLPSFPT